MQTDTIEYTIAKTNNRAILAGNNLAIYIDSDNMASAEIKNAKKALLDWLNGNICNNYIVQDCEILYNGTHIAHIVNKDIAERLQPSHIDDVAPIIEKKPAAAKTPKKKRKSKK